MKPVFSRELGAFIVTNLVNAPDSQVSGPVRDRVCAASFNLSKMSGAQLFDWCAELSKLPLTEISSFVKVLCDVEQFYLRPAE